MLLTGNGRGRNTTAVMLGRMNRKTTPAGANLQKVIVFVEIQFLAQAIILFDRCVLHGVLIAIENTARVSHRFVEKQLVELIAQVVVCGNVFPAAPFCVSIQQVTASTNTIDDCIEQASQSIRCFDVTTKQLNQRGQITTGPCTINVRFAGAHAATQRN